MYHLKISLQDAVSFAVLNEGDKDTYSQTCIKRSPLRQRKSGLLIQVTSEKRFNSYEIFYDRTRKKVTV
jgi:hypothetical protein